MNAFWATGLDDAWVSRYFHFTPPTPGKHKIESIEVWYVTVLPVEVSHVFKINVRYRWRHQRSHWIKFAYVTLRWMKKECVTSNHVWRDNSKHMLYWAYDLDHYQIFAKQLIIINDCWWKHAWLRKHVFGVCGSVLWHIHTMATRSASFSNTIICSWKTLHCLEWRLSFTVSTCAFTFLRKTKKSGAKTKIKQIKSGKAMKNT